MKKFLFLSIVSLALFVSTNAQIGIASEYKPKKSFFAAEKGGIKFGLKAGGNFYNIGGDADDADLTESRKIKIGIGGGVVVNIPISEMFSFQPELLFSSEGNLQKEGDAKIIIALNYINIPLLAQLNTTSGFYAETGPQIGFLMSAKQKIKFEDEEEEDDIKDSFNGFNFAWAIGLGFKTKNGLGFGARYNLGLSNIVDSEDDDDEFKLTTNGFHVGLFWMFGGEKK